MGFPLGKNTKFVFCVPVMPPTHCKKLCQKKRYKKYLEEYKPA